jgi:hypothetical protein
LLTQRAIASTLPARIAYEAPAECAEHPAFVGEVRARTEHLQQSPPDTLAWPIVVSIRRSEPARFLGQVAFDDVDGQRAVRQVEGSSCAEVVSSLALIVALAIDDRVASNEPSSVAPTPPFAAPDAPKATLEPGVTPAPRATPEAPRRVESAPIRWAWSFGGNLGVSSWHAPNLARSLGLFGELSPNAGSTTLRLSWFDVRRNPALGGISSHFLTEVGRIEGCPFALELGAGSRLSLSPCLGLDVGMLRASVDPSPELTGARGKTIFWSAAVAELRLRWRPTRLVLVELDGELGAPLVRHSFVLENPPRTLFDVPALGVGTKIGVGLHFP